MEFWAQFDWNGLGHFGSKLGKDYYSVWCRLASFDWIVDRFMAAPVSFAADVPLASVPALSPLALLGTGLFLLVVGRRS